MQIENKLSLAPHTTFKIGGPAKYFAVAANPKDVSEYLEFAQKNNVRVLILGGGSNVLISDQGFPGLVIQVKNTGVAVQSEDGDQVTLNVAAGEVWDDVVDYAAERGWWGIENLSHIPGSAGASAVQNIGAYGQEASRVINSVTTMDLKSGRQKVLTKTNCGFSYRSSIFNTSQRACYLIWEIQIQLSKLPNPQLGYPDLAKQFSSVANPGIDQIREAVISIRDKKYPFPTQAVLGNAGSFFKNFVLKDEEFSNLRSRLLESFGASAAEKLDAIRNRFPQPAGIKVPTAFLMELCGLKGLSRGNVQINETNPLVLLNKTGQARASEVLEVVKEVRQTVKDKTGLMLNLEPELIGFGEDELIKYGFTDIEIQRYSVFGV